MRKANQRLITTNTTGTRTAAWTEFHCENYLVENSYFIYLFILVRVSVTHASFHLHERLQNIPYDPRSWYCLFYY